MPHLPTGTVTFLFTDIEGSTRLLQHIGDARANQVFEEYRHLLRKAIAAAGGHELQNQGDGFLFVFHGAHDAVLAAVAAQRAFTTHPWSDSVHLRVRMGLHTGEPVTTSESYVGLDVHRAARICAAGYGGQILLSRTTRDLLEHDLQLGMGLRDLGSHRLKDLQRPEKLFQLLHPDLPAEFPTLKSLDAFPNNLPIQLTSFIGREREMVELKRLLKMTHLMTLTGPGGCGKTRLALQVAADLLEEFPDGVWLVELAALTDPGLVPQAVASAININEQPGRALMITLEDHLRPKRVLLLLDNCEHLVAASAQVINTLLHHCPSLRFLATSREALNIQGEMAFVMPVLSVPDLRRSLTSEDLREYEAVRLFIDRATVALPTFRVTETNAPAVAQVCYWLDGIPLAIELAAARVRVLSVEEIAARLDDRFRLLTGGSRTALPRHQTLEAAVDWSYDLLAEEERALLRRLSVFAGGFTLEAAEAVCAGGTIESLEVMNLLTRLVEKSLVTVQPQNRHMRYRLLETVRQYGLNRLRHSGEADGFHRRHRDWYLVMAERAEPRLHGPDQGPWLERLEVEHDNLRAALEWSKTDQDAAEPGLRLAATLWEFWYVRGYWTEGRRWLGQALIQSRMSKSERAKAMVGAGALAWRQGDYKQAIALGEESLALCRELGDKGGMAIALNHLAHVAFERGDYERAAALAEKSLELSREVGDKWTSAFPLGTLGRIALHLGDLDQAGALFTESLAIRREIGHQLGIAMSLRLLGDVAALQGDYQRATALHKESLALSGRLGDQRGITQCLESLAGAALARGEPRKAARLLGAAEALREAIGFPMSPIDRDHYRRRVTVVRDRLNESAFAEAWGKGRTAPLNQAIDEGMSV